MRITHYDKLVAHLALWSGLSISAVAVYYSVAGLVSIFAASVVPIVIMGVVLELGKLVATIWLKQNWFIAPRVIRAYLFTAVVILMGITSMGIFGYLSKAHLDQAVPTGDVATQVELIDAKIQTQKDNIETSRKALAQMDASVDQVMARSTAESGAVRATQIRKSQSKERASLQNDIAAAQKEIAKLNEEKAPFAKELRKVEAEVGPIKYIAALIYGDNLSTDSLERAVRWVIIILVVIFDPLAVVLLLASQYSFQWFRKMAEEETPVICITEPDTVETPRTSLPTDELKEDTKEMFSNDPNGNYVEGFIEEQPPSGALTDPDVARAAFKAVFFDHPEYFDKIDSIKFSNEEEIEEVSDLKKYPYLTAKPKTTLGSTVGPVAYTPEPKAIELTIDELAELDPELAQQLEEEADELTHDALEASTEEVTADETTEIDSLERPGDYIQKDEVESEAPHTYITKEQDKQIKMVYIQNSEQTEESKWNKLNANR